MEKDHSQISVLKNKNRILPLLSIFNSLLFIYPSGISVAQDNTMYLMHSIPQANQLNPALMRPCGIYVELPVISSVRLNIRNTGFGFHDVFQPGTGPQTDTYFLDVDKLDKKLKGINYFQTETDIDLLGFGFGLKDWYFTFGIVNHSDLLLTYPHTIVSLTDSNLQMPDGNGNSISLGKTGVEITAWNSIGISAAKVLHNGLTVGVRLKYLQGMANVISRRSELLINTTADPVTLEAHMNSSINASFPLRPGVNPKGVVTSLNFDNIFNNPVSDFIFNGNRGMSIDAGLVYDLNEIMQFTASITDLGFIRWRKNINNFTSNVNYLFNGTELDRFQVNPGQLDLLKALRDSISAAFRVSGSKYFTLTSVKIFGGVTRVILPNLRAGAMTRIELYHLHLMPSLSLSMNYTPYPFVDASMSYTLMNNKFNQVGAGIAIGNKGAQFYMVADNIPFRFKRNVHFPGYTDTPLILPYNARMLSLRMGVNLLFGCNPKENKNRPRNFSRRDSCPAYW
jgi:hypothetical protein